MSLSRAFTMKRIGKKSDSFATMPTRSLTTKRASTASAIRNNISAPVELLSTTNMMSYHAPDINPISAVSNSSQSTDDLDRSPTNSSTPYASTDSSSIESTSPTSVEPNHLSCYFGSAASGEKAPTIPNRSPSHTKSKASVDTFLARRSTASASDFSQKNTTTTRSSLYMFCPNPDLMDHQPFSQELAQVSEIAEEYGVPQESFSTIDEKEEQDLVSRGFFKFAPEDYMTEINGLYLEAFGKIESTASSLWI